MSPNLLSLDRLPLILAGPILRRTEPDAVTVWLALRKSCRVTLRIYTTDGGEGVRRNQPLLEGSRTTVQLGQHLHIVAVTAQSSDGFADLASSVRARLQPGQIYAYDLDLGSYGNLLAALNSAGVPDVTISYFDHGLPTFAMPPEDLNYLRIAHGSCRKPHGGGHDALPLLDHLIEQAANVPDSRPHQLFLTGDQIYGDDVADPLLWAACEVGNLLLGWEENLPIQKQSGEESVKSRELQPGQRSDIARDYGGFTAMLHDQPEKAKSHLFSLGEYYALYLFAWSSVLLPDRFTQKAKQAWNQEVHAIEDLKLPGVRRALANVPTYTICDDHDISDDWYLNREWCYRVLGKPLGRRVLQNGLLAYAVFQAWGNTPEQFMPGQPGEKLLQAAETWSASAGTDGTAWEEIAKHLGIPPIDPQTGLPKLKRDGDVFILDRDYTDGTTALDWHYTVRSFKHEVIVLDTRTWRGYPKEEEGTTAPPWLLSPTAFEEQIQNPLEQTDQLKQAGESSVEATLVVVPTNPVSLSVIDLVQNLDLKQEKVFSHDVGDSWNFNDVAFSKLLATLFQRRDRIVLLSGDIHYGGAVRLNYWSPRPQETSEKASVLAQLTSSAIKNAEWTTYLIHTKAKSLVPEQPENWAGWKEPPQLAEIVATPYSVRILDVEVPEQGPILWQMHPPRGNGEVVWEIAVKDTSSLPDWRYQIEWIEREKAQIVANGKHQKSATRFSALRNSPLWFWRNQWLQEGKEVVGRNNISLVCFQWSEGAKAVIQQTYWHPPWNPTSIVQSRYLVPLRLEDPPPLPRVIGMRDEYGGRNSSK
ncbi:MAG: PhoD-like phosphatase [Cyanobacteria bacterium QS_1_48_34]|nr:MAG: PhoD-like phosphatase [Cyanobacteria bacterium QS_1_48_34]